MMTKGKGKIKLLELLLARLSKASVVGREGYVSHLIVRGMGEVDLLFLLDRVREGEMIGLYTVKFLFFKLYIYDILHVQICLLKMKGIHLNTLELHWARPWQPAFIHRHAKLKHCIVSRGKNLVLLRS